MADPNADWSTDSNAAVYISLVVPDAGGSKTIHTFHPKFTYPIFGEEETVFGYQGLKINLRYNACDMRPCLQITYNKKFKAVGDTEATDLKAALEPFLPKPAFEKTSVFETAIKDATYASWKPPGELWKTMEDGEKTFEVWKGSLADPAVQQMLKRVQILVPLFIEGGTLLELQDEEWSLDRWTVFFLYEKKSIGLAPEISPYTFMGYSTVYRYFYFQPTPSNDPPSVKKQRISRPATLDFQLPLPESPFSSLPCRSRISQFLILPSFQGGGNGSRFYNSIFDFYLHEASTIEITVEDPNEAFDDLRDLNDLTLLRTIPDFLSLRINTSVIPRLKGPVPRDILNIDTLEAIRKSVKIAPRQFSRLVEMQLLSRIPTSIRQSLLLSDEKGKGKVPDSKEREKEYRLWQLWVKKRLYKHNKDMLMQLDRVERIDKLEQALGGVEADYARLLRALESRGKGQNAPANGSGKRSSPDDETMEDDTSEPAAKRVKFAA